MGEGVYSRLGAWVQRRRAAIIAAYCAATLLFGWLSTRITLAPDITDLLPAGAPAAADLKLYLSRFGTLDHLFITLHDERPDPEERLEAAAEQLAARLRGQELITAIRWGFTPEDLLGLARRAMRHLPALVPEQNASALRARVEPGAVRAALERLQRDATLASGVGMPLEEMAAEDPLGLLDLVPLPGQGGGAPVQPDPGSGLFLSPDYATLLIVADPARPPADIAFSNRLLSELDAALAELEASYPGVHADYAGGHLFAAHDAGRIRRDMIMTTCVSIGAIVVLFALAMRRLGVLLILAIPLTLSTIWTLGIASVYPGRLNLVSVGFAAVLLGMGDDALTHLYVRFREELARGGARTQAAAAALAGTARPVIVATLTTGAAFGMLAFVHFRGLAELGIIAAIGLINLLISALLLFPALLGYGPSRAEAPAHIPVAPVHLPVAPFLALHQWGLRHRRLALGGAAAVAIVAALLCTRLTFSSDVAALRGTDDAAVRMTRLFAPFGSFPEPLHIIVEGGSPEEALQASEALLPLCAQLEKEQAITGCASPASWVPSVRTQRERAAALGAIDWDGVASSLTTASASLEMRESYFAPFLQTLRGWSDPDRVLLAPEPGSGPGTAFPGLSGSTAATTLSPAPERDPVEVAARAREIAASMGLPGPLRIAAPALVTRELGDVIQRDFRTAGLLAIVAVAAIAWAAFRSTRRLLLAALPVAMGCLLMLGVMAATGMPINLMNLIAVPIVVGLGIDFGVYLLSRHIEDGGDGAQALAHTGGPMLLTGATTITGFGSLMTAQFAGLRSIGLAAVVGIAGALLSALTLLPLLLPRKPS